MYTDYERQEKEKKNDQSTWIVGENLESQIETGTHTHVI
jgi:hypothetical protein